MARGQGCREDALKQLHYTFEELSLSTEPCEQEHCPYAIRFAADLVASFSALVGNVSESPESNDMRT